MKITKDWCLNMAAKEGDAEIGAGMASCDPMPPTSESDAQRAFEEAMADRQDPLHPMFRSHNCWKCNSGERPCVAKRGPANCEYPHARND